MQNITIHIGMPKCASTTLQRGFFSKIPSISYIGLGDNNPVKSFDKIFFKEKMYYDHKEILEEIKTVKGLEKPLVISREASLVHPFPHYKQFLDKTTIAERYKELFPDAKIVLIIRNQFNFHKSMYHQVIHNKELKVRKRYNKWIQKNIKISEEYTHFDSIFESADYNKIYELYNKLFNNVKVFIFEEITTDFKSFMKSELCDFIGINGDEAIKYFDNIRYNKRHSYYPFPINLIMKNIDNDKLSKESKKYIYNYYKESNRALSDKLGFDLKKFNYPI